MSPKIQLFCMFFPIGTEHGTDKNCSKSRYDNQSGRIVQWHPPDCMNGNGSNGGHRESANKRIEQVLESYTFLRAGNWRLILILVTEKGNRNRGTVKTYGRRIWTAIIWRFLNRSFGVSILIKIIMLCIYYRMQHLYLVTIFFKRFLQTFQQSFIWERSENKQKLISLNLNSEIKVRYNVQAAQRGIWSVKDSPVGLGINHRREGIFKRWTMIPIVCN